MFGNYAHFGSSTFNYFWQATSEAPPPIYKLFYNILTELNIPLELINKYCLLHHILFFEISKINKDQIQERKKINFGFPNNGRLLQIFVPRSLVDEIAYSSVVRGQPVDLRYPGKEEKLTAENFNTFPQTRHISHLLKLLRKNPDSLENILKLNRTIPDLLVQEQPFHEQEASPYRVDFFNNPNDLKYISLMESRLYLGSQHFEDTKKIRIKSYDRFPRDPESYKQYQQGMSKLVKNILSHAFTYQPSLNGWRLNTLCKFINSQEDPPKLGLSSTKTETNKTEEFFSIMEAERKERALANKIEQGDVQAVQDYFKGQLEKIDTLISVPIITPVAAAHNTSNSNGNEIETFAYFIKIKITLMTPLKFAFQCQGKNDKLIYTLLTCNPSMIEDLIRKYSTEIYMYAPWVSEPNPLLIRLAYHFYERNISLSRLRIALGDPPSNVWNTLAECIFSSYGTSLRRNLCDYALQEGLSLKERGARQSYSPLHSPNLNENRYLDTIKYNLTTAGEDIGVLGSNKRNAFITASLYGYPEVLAYLASRGDTNLLYKDQQGLSAISYSASSGRTDVIDFFLNLSIPELSHKRKVELIFHSALIQRNLKIIQYLESIATKIPLSFHSLMESKGENGNNGYKNLILGYSAPLYLYLEKYVNIYGYRDENKNSLLHFALATFSHNTNIKELFLFVKFLLKRGFNFLETNLTGETPWNYFYSSALSKNNQTLYIEYLQDFIASLSDENRLTFLTKACDPKNDIKIRKELTSSIIYYWHPDTFQILNLDVLLPSKRPLLHQIIQNEYVDLLHSIFNLFSYNSEQMRTSLFRNLKIALESQRIYMLSPCKLIKIYPIQKYMEVGSSIFSSMGIESSWSKEFFRSYLETDNSKSLFHMLLTSKYSNQLQDTEGLSLLSVASCLGMTDYAKALLERNADPLSQDKKGNNALFYAIHSNAYEIVQLLIDHIINTASENYLKMMTRPNSFQRTPLIEAARRKRLYCLEILLKSEETYLEKTMTTTREKDGKNPSSSILDLNFSDYRGDTVLSLIGKTRPEHCQEIQEYTLRE